uniref:Uncharacterized protein n=1 Tax=Ixodes ricinus TaxID=34613 RepID=A0A6B0U3S4_IXORI
MESGDWRRPGMEVVLVTWSCWPSSAFSRAAADSEPSSFALSSSLSSRKDCRSRGSFITSSRHRPPSSIAMVPGLNIPKTWNRPCRTVICY